MELTYRMQGDYRLPNLIPPESPKVGKYGMLRHSYLRKHREGLYTGMLMEGTLNAHLEEVDREANRMLEQLTTQMALEQGVTEELKARDQMLWVQRMNNIWQAAEEIIYSQLIYLMAGQSVFMMEVSKGGQGGTPLPTTSLQTKSESVIVGYTHSENVV